MKVSAICGVYFLILSCAIEEDGADVRAGEQVLHVVAELGQLHDLALVLGVHGVELFVHALELFVRALELLVGRQELLVGGLELLVRGLELLGRRLQVLFGVDELRLESAHLLARQLGELELGFEIGALESSLVSKVMRTCGIVPPRCWTRRTVMW